MNNIHIKTIKSRQDLTPEMEQAWCQHLIEVHDPRSIFQNLEVYFATPENNPRVNGLLAFMIYQDTQLIGLLAFLEQTVTVRVNFGLVKLLSTQVNEIRSVGSGIVKTTGNDTTLMNEITNKLKSIADQSKAQIFLEANEERDFLYGLTGKGLVSRKLKTTETFIAKLEDTFELFLKAKTKSKRQSLNKDLKRFEKNFPERSKIKRNSDNFINDAKLILNNSWKKGLVGSIVGSANFEKQLALLSSQQLVETFILEVDDKPIAFAIGYHTNRHFFYEEIAYDENFAKSGAGSYLTISVVKAMHEREPCEESQYFSFGVGDNIYKRKLYSEMILCEDRVLALPFSKVSTFLALKFFMNKSYQGFREVLLKMGIHRYIRQKLKQRSIKG